MTKDKDPWIFVWDEPNKNQRVRSFCSYHLNERGDYDAEEAFYGLHELEKKMEEARAGLVTMRDKHCWWLAAKRFLTKEKKPVDVQRVFETVPVVDLYDYYEQVLVSLLYQLGRDLLPLGELERLLRAELSAHRDEDGNNRLIDYSNKHLHSWAKEWSRALLSYPQKEMEGA